jgi:hypothetical protein
MKSLRSPTGETARNEVILEVCRVLLYVLGVAREAEVDQVWPSRLDDHVRGNEVSVVEVCGVEVSP